MSRTIIDMPLPLMRLTQVGWDIDWAGQSAGRGVDASDQVVLNRFPRFMASLALRFESDGIGWWRAFRARLEGNTNAIRLRMVDPVTMHSVGPAVDGDWQAWLAGSYVEPRPQVRCTVLAAAGAASIIIDETAARAPVQVGAHLSHDDWPFLVTGRSGSGASVTLDVAMLRRAIPADAMIDLIPRGLFLMTDPSQGAATYGRQKRIAPELSLAEWITR